MFINVTEYLFLDEWLDSGRSESFTREGLTALYNFLIELEDCGGAEELDIVALDCTFCEYKNLTDYNEVNSLELDSIEEIDDIAIAIPGTERFIVEE